jgi:hypothetical protein
MSDLDLLWPPVRIGHVQTRNRIYLPAHQLFAAARVRRLPGRARARRRRPDRHARLPRAPVFVQSSARAGVSPWEPAWADAVHKFVTPARSLRQGVPVFVQITDTLLGRKLEPTGDWPWLMPRTVAAGVRLRQTAFIEEHRANRDRPRHTTQHARRPGSEPKRQATSGGP